MRRALPSAFLIVLLGGCISTQTDVVLRSNGSGEITFRYTIDREVYDLGVFDEHGATRPLPVTRSEFRAAADRLEGVRLRGYRERSGDAVVEIEARLSFAAADGLIALLGPGAVELEQSGVSGRFRYEIAPTVEPTGEQGALLARSLDSYRLVLRFDAPRPVSHVNVGTVTDRGVAELALTLADIAVAAQPLVWEVRW